MSRVLPIVAFRPPDDPPGQQPAQQPGRAGEGGRQAWAMAYLLRWERCGGQWHGLLLWVTQDGDDGPVDRHQAALPATEIRQVADQDYRRVPRVEAASSAANSAGSVPPPAPAGLIGSTDARSPGKRSRAEARAAHERTLRRTVEPDF